MYRRVVLDLVDRKRTFPRFLGSLEVWKVVKGAKLVLDWSTFSPPGAGSRGWIFGILVEVTAFLS